MAAMLRTGADSDLHRLASEIVRRAGLELVQLSLRGSGGGRVLRVDVDRPGPTGVSLDDCQEVSRSLSVALDEADPIPSNYVLEVSSPGADRPIRTADDIRRNTGRRVVVTAHDDEHGQRSFCGLLEGAEDGCLLLSDDRREKLRIPLDDIVKAHQELKP